MSSRYRLKFLPEALEEWNALDGSVKAVLRKLLKSHFRIWLHGQFLKFIQPDTAIMTLFLALVLAPVCAGPGRLRRLFAD